MVHGSWLMAHGLWLMAQPGEYYTTSKDGSYSPGNTPVKPRNTLEIEGLINGLEPNRSDAPMAQAMPVEAFSA